MGTKRLDQFDRQQYLNIETYRKNGQAVPTPVWFVKDGEKLFVRTGAKSGKVKRILGNSKVRVMPCDARGKPKGDWVGATAQVVDKTMSDQVNGLLKKKYGLTKWLFELFGGTNKMESATLSIVLEEE